MKPWISVIVPVYNVEAYLEKCVDSLQNQNLSEIEIILVDDSSTDTSGKLCDELAQTYSNVKAVHKSNGGLASARNAGMEWAEGEYIAFVDSDDWMEPDAYKIMYENCRTAKPDILNYGYQKVCDGKVLIREHAEFSEGWYDHQEIQSRILPDSIAHKMAFDQVNLPTQLSACMCIYRREFLLQHGLQFESERIVLNEDWLFNIRCLCHAKSMLILHDVFYNYVTRGTSLSQSYKTDAYERRKILYRRYQEELALIGRQDPEIQQRLRNFWMESIYCCYIIELNAPKWNKAVMERMNRICADFEFLASIQMMDRSDCTIKGRVFLMIVKYKLHGIMRIAYRMKKKLESLQHK